MVSPIWSVVAEIDEARLVGMECQSIPCKALAQNAEDPLGIEEILECQHGIVSSPMRLCMSYLYCKLPKTVVSPLIGTGGHGALGGRCRAGPEYGFGFDAIDRPHG
jgi:hypothetical protein